MLAVSYAARAAALLSAVAAVVAGTARLALEPIAAAWTPLRDLGPAALTDGVVSFDGALAALCAVVLVACVLWLTVTTTVAVLAHVVADLSPSSRSALVLDRAAQQGCPRTLRRLAALALGVALTGGAGVAAASAARVPAPPAHGSGAPTPNTLSAADTLSAAETLSAADDLRAPESLPLLDGLALPDRTTGGVATRPADASDGQRTSNPSARRPTLWHAPRTTAGADAVARGSPRDPWVEVLPGDSLWVIAERLLPARAGNGQITASWHRLHAANRTAIGPDPDLVLPGTRLHVPRLPGAASAALPRSGRPGPALSSAAPSSPPAPGAGTTPHPAPGTGASPGPASSPTPTPSFDLLEDLS